jgi:hypothetical protein
VGGEGAPEIQETPQPEPVDPEAIKRAVEQLWQRAYDHIHDEIGPKLARVWRYYDGKVDFPPAYEVGKDEAGNPIFHGNSTVVREVWDKVHGVLPELARVFLSSDEAVVYEPKRRDQAAWAEQATDYANWVFRTDNNGEEQLLESFIAWLVKFCAWKVYWEKSTRDQPESGRIPEAELKALLEEQQAEGSNIISLQAMPVVETVSASQVGPDGQPVTMSMPIVMYDVELTREITEGRIVIELVPQDEFTIDPDAQGADDALFIGSDGLRTVSSVVAQGIPFDTVREYAGRSGSNDMNTEAQVARRGRANNQTFASDIGDPALDYVRVVEAIVMLDTDGDGIAERHRVLMLGDSPKVVKMKAGDDCYYIVGSPYRRPHEPIGTGVGEAVIDLQEDKTRLTRGIHNNINRSNTPRPVVLADDATAIGDLKSPLGPNGSGMIRKDTPAPIEWHITPFMGDKMFPMLEYYDNLGATRTGITPAGQGLDADILKGTTVDGTKLVANSAQTRIEYLVREYAAGCMRPMFRAILKLSKKFQSKATTIRIRGQWVDVDPSMWDDDMDVAIQVGLGTGTRPERMAGIMAIRAAQTEELAIGSPLVTTKERGESLRTLANLVGFPTPGKFFKEMSDEELAQAEQQKAEQAKQQMAEQAQMAAMIEAEKAAAKAKVDQETTLQKAQVDAELQTRDAAAKQQQAERDAMMAAQQAERERMAAAEQADRDFQAKLAEIASRERATLDKQQRDFALRMAEMDREFELEKLRMRNKAESGNANLETD